MNTPNNNNVLAKLLLLFTVTGMSLTGCGSKPRPIVQEEPVVVGSNIAEPYEPMPADGMRPASDDAAMVESSGIAPPMDENIIEPNPDVVPGAMDTPVETNSMAAASLAGTPGDYYAIQVVAASSMANLEKFAQKYNLSTNLTAEVNAKGRLWYVLIYATYPTLEEAKAAMPEVRGMVTTRPWIRKVSSLH